MGNGHLQAHREAVNFHALASSDCGVFSAAFVTSKVCKKLLVRIEARSHVFRMPRRQDQPPPWPHAPTHLLDASGIYFVTAATHLKQHFFRDPARLEVLHRGLLGVTQEFGWQLEAWAVFSNHYHFVAKTPPNVQNAESLPRMIRALHGPLARWINKLDQMPERRVWHNYWETLLTHRTSYFARLNYTHNNAVKHGLVKVAREYPWCSARWFEQETAPAMVRAISRFKTDRVKVEDDFRPEWPA